MAAPVERLAEAIPVGVFGGGTARVAEALAAEGVGWLERRPPKNRGSRISEAVIDTRAAWLAS